MQTNALSELSFDGKTAKRATWEAFDMSVPASGTVVVENMSYGAASGEHTHAVNVEDGVPVSCTCKADEWQAGACKHRVAVALREAVLAAASHESTQGDADAEPKTAIADGGVVVEDADADADAETETATAAETNERGVEGCSCLAEMDGLGCFACYQAGFETPAPDAPAYDDEDEHEGER